MSRRSLQRPRRSAVSAWPGGPALAVLAASLPAGCAPAGGEPPPAQEPVALVVMLAVDQMRADYLDRFAHQLTGGLARIRNGSAYFPNGRQNHAITQTAPGHATLLSGRYPARVGILSNDSGVPDRESPLIGSSGTGASPHRFVGTALHDWMAAADPGARVLSVSRKDRGAILPVGRARGHVYWLSAGGFTTSAWYADALPDWVEAVNEGLRPEDWYGREWTLLLPESEYPEPDDVPGEAAGGSATFPHVLPHDLDGLLTEMERFPWTDSLTLAFALAGVEALELGRRAGPDLLSISLSVLDGVGHHWGPDSREVHDHVVRVDRWLGAFLDSLAVLVAGPTLLAFSSDHGVTPIPEIRLARGEAQAGRIDLASLTRELGPELQGRFGGRFGLGLTSSLMLADTAAMGAAGLAVDSLAAELAARARALPGVRRVFTPAELAVAPPGDDEAGAWRRSIPPHVGWLLAVTPEPGYFVGGTRTAQHGPPTADNAQVPIAIMGPGVLAARHERPVDTVDIAATLAVMLGVRPLEPLDGVALPEVLERFTPPDRD